MEIKQIIKTCLLVSLLTFVGQTWAGKQSEVTLEQRIENAQKALNEFASLQPLENHDQIKDNEAWLIETRTKVSNAL